MDNSNFIKNKINIFYNLTYKYKFYIVIVFCILIILYVSYLFSEGKRIDTKLKYLTNNLNYSKEKINIEFCDFHNSIIIEAPITITITKTSPKDKHTLTIHFKEGKNYEKNKLNSLYDYGVNSSYFFNLEIINDPANSNNNYKDPYIIENIDKPGQKITINTTSEEDDKDKNEKQEIYGSTFKDKDKDILKKSAKLTFFNINHEKNTYGSKKLCEYYICSSYRSYLVGNQFLDYSSKHMISKILYYGCRYIELDIYDKDNKNDTIPVISTGIDKQRYKIMLNEILFEECIEIISKFAFSDKFLNNFNDPLFLFLNINTNNYKTLNKIAEIIKQYLNHFLLDKSYNHTNIANLKLCELKRKIVLLCNEDKYKNSDLDIMINASTDKPYLRRIAFNDVLYEKSISSEPKVIFSSNRVKFVKDIKDYILINDNSINLLILGLKKGDKLQISGANQIKNNSGQYLLTIDQVTKNKIVFIKSIELENENPGASVVFKGYDKNMGNMGLQEYNKENITIVIPDKQFFSNNYKYKTAFFKGCQFVAMNFQTLDENLNNYFNYFEEKSFVFKPNVLVKYKKVSKIKSLNSMLPKVKKSIDIDIDYFTINKFTNGAATSAASAASPASAASEKYIIIKPYYDDTIRLIKDDNVARLSLEYTNNNSIFYITDDNSKVKINHVENGLHSSLAFSKCCYVNFKNDAIIDNDNYENKFYLMNPPLNKKNYISFGVIRTNETTQEEELYYLKYRNYYDSNKKLYIKKQNKYDLITILVSESRKKKDYKVILRPRVSSSFYSYGDICVNYSDLDTLDSANTTAVNTTAVNTTAVIANQDIYEKIDPIKLKQKNLETDIVSGAVDFPQDYELLYENKFFETENPVNYNKKELSIWRPIPKPGYLAAGVVFSESNDKPKLETVVCISTKYLEEIDDKANISNVYNHKKSKLALFKGSSKHVNYSYYFEDSDKTVPLNSVIPNLIEFKMYNLITEEKDYSDRLYLDKNIKTNEDKLSCMFKFEEYKSISDEDGSNIYDYLMKLKNDDGKLISYTKSDGGSNMCLSLPTPYWTSFYNEVQPGNTIEDTKDNGEADLEFGACNNRQFFGTNWNYYDDNTIRLEGNPKYCVTFKNDLLNNPIVDIKNDVNSLYLSKCSEDLQNQQFNIDKNIKPIIDSNVNACVTHGPNNEARLEECGDNKYYSIWNWKGNTYNESSCFKKDAENKLGEVGGFEECIDLSYFVLANSGVISHEEFNSKSAATSDYDSKVSSGKYPSGVAIVNKNAIIEISTSNKLFRSLFENYIKILDGKDRLYSDCKIASKLICNKNTMSPSIYTHFEDENIKEELNNYCANIKEDNTYKCERTLRQQFLNKIVPRNYCLDYNKMVYIYLTPGFLKNLIDNANTNIYNKKFIKYYGTFVGLSKDTIDKISDSYKINTNLKNADTDTDGNLNLNRQTTIDLNDPVLKSNSLLGENIEENFEIFLKGIITETNDKNEFKINFIQPERKFIILKKYDYHIILDSIPKPEHIKIGTQVICSYINKKKEDDDTNPSFNGIHNENVRYKGVVIKKYKNNRYGVMFSVQSYKHVVENDDKPDRNRESNIYNITKIFDLEDLILLKNAPLCKPN